MHPVHDEEELEDNYSPEACNEYFGSLITRVFNLIISLCHVCVKQLLGFSPLPAPNNHLTLIISANIIV